jgi:hypothetical protein
MPEATGGVRAATTRAALLAHRDARGPSRGGLARRSE